MFIRYWRLLPSNHNLNKPGGAGYYTQCTLYGSEDSACQASGLNEFWIGLPVRLVFGRYGTLLWVVRLHSLLS